MRVGLIHKGSAWPNVALMRLSSYHKQMGDTVIMNPNPMIDRPDLVYISTIFTWQRANVEAIAAQFRTNADVQIGGSGWDLSLRLPAEVDTMPNDYDLVWPKHGKIPYGIGYSSRGCIRRCGFCPVPKSEGKIHEDNSIASLLNPASNQLALLDNNFFASDWQPKFAEIYKRKLAIDWPQGLDIRLLDDLQAEALGYLRKRGQIWGGHFTKRNVLHFAWDLPSNNARKDEVLRGIRLLFKAGYKPGDLRFFVLIGYPGYDFGEEIERIRTLHELNIEPYVMVYRDYSVEDHRSRSHMDLQHWNASHMWRKTPFEQYDRRRTGGRHLPRPPWFEPPAVKRPRVKRKPRTAEAKAAISMRMRRWRQENACPSCGRTGGLRSIKSTGGIIRQCRWRDKGKCEYEAFVPSVSDAAA